MRSSLIDTLFLSDKRKELLLFLKDGKKNSEEIKAVFDYPWKSMIPQIRKLVEWDLITYDKGDCALTPMGHIIVMNLESFLTTLEVHEKYRKYWTKHDIRSIPEGLLYRIGDLCECEILEPDIPNIFEQQEETLNKIDGSDRIMAFVSVHHPAQLVVYSELMEKGTKLDLIMTEDVYRIVKGDIMPSLSILQIESPIFHSLKEKYEKEIENLFNDPRSCIFVYKGDIKPLNLVVTESFFSLTLPDSAGKYNNAMLTSSDIPAISWGKALFDHYRNISEELTETEVEQLKIKKEN